MHLRLGSRVAAGCFTHRSPLVKSGLWTVGLTELGRELETNRPPNGDGASTAMPPPM